MHTWGPYSAHSLHAAIAVRGSSLDGARLVVLHGRYPVDASVAGIGVAVHGLQHHSAGAREHHPATVFRHHHLYVFTIGEVDRLILVCCNNKQKKNKKKHKKNNNMSQVRKKWVCCYISHMRKPRCCLGEWRSGGCSHTPTKGIVLRQTLSNTTSIMKHRYVAIIKVQQLF